MACACGQVLLTQGDFEDRVRWITFSSTAAGVLDDRGEAPAPSLYGKTCVRAQTPTFTSTMSISWAHPTGRHRGSQSLLTSTTR